MMAAVLPTMVLTATVLRAGGLSVKRIVDLRNALMRQLHVWAGLFLISLGACVLVIVGQVFDWNIPLTVPTIETRYVAVDGFSFDVVRILNGAIVGLLTLLLVRSKAVVDGLRSLIALSADVAISEAEQRNIEQQSLAQRGINELPERPDFGSYTDLRN
jgi:hypothetical protein